jgi:hypothetical protein
LLSKYPTDISCPSSLRNYQLQRNRRQEFKLIKSLLHPDQIVLIIHRLNLELELTLLEIKALILLIVETRLIFFRKTDLGRIANLMTGKASKLRNSNSLEILRGRLSKRLILHKSMWLKSLFNNLLLQEMRIKS